MESMDREGNWLKVDTTLMEEGQEQILLIKGKIKIPL